MEPSCDFILLWLLHARRPESLENNLDHLTLNKNTLKSCILTIDILKGRESVQFREVGSKGRTSTTLELVIVVGMYSNYLHCLIAFSVHLGTAKLMLHLLPVTYNGGYM